MKTITRVLGSLAALSTAGPALAQSTAFIYQGQLKSSGVAATGLHDFRFRLYDAAALGTQIGSTQCADNVTVTEGRFNASIDFGPAFASTAPQFLEIDVRQDTGQNCANIAGYTLLSPRQPVTPAPRVSAANAANILTAPGSSVIALTSGNAGNIGIGTTAPTHPVHIAQPVPALALQDSDSTTNQVGYVDYRDSANASRGWVGYGTAGDPDFSIINARPAGDIVFSTLGGGRVGIGTASPVSTLEVRGDIRVGASGQYFAAAGEQPLRIVYGTASNLNDCGGIPTPIHAGSGFHFLDNSGFSGWLIEFDEPFSAVPSVVGSSYWDSFFGGKYVSIESVTPSQFRIRVFASSGDTICRQFSFIAIGPR